MVRRLNHELLAATRLELGLTQEQAAESLAIDVRTYRRYETGEVNHPAKGFPIRSAKRRRILERIVQEFGISEHELWAPARSTSELVSLQPARWKVRHAHTLPRARHYVGREEVLGHLRAWLGRAEPGAKVFALVGLGGSGKTSIVERVLSDLGEGPHRNGVFVFSFYDDARIDVCLKQALAYFEIDSSDDDSASPLERLQRALRDAPAAHLVVLDGLEVMQANGCGEDTYGRIIDGSLRRLMTSAARGLGCTRFLVTSRFELSDLSGWEGSGLQTLQVGALTPAEAKTLLARWGVTGNDGVLDGLLQRVGRHALSVATLGSYAGNFLSGNISAERGREIEQLLQASTLLSIARDDAQARRLVVVLSAYAGALAAQERDALTRLAVFPGEVSAEQLESMARGSARLAGALAGLSRPDIERILARLARLGLIHSSDGKAYAAHPIVAEYFRSLLVATPSSPSESLPPLQTREAGDHALIDWRTIPEALCLDLQHSSYAEQPAFAAYETIVHHILRSGDPARAAQIYRRHLGGFTELGLRHGEMTRGERILRAFAPDGDPEQAAIGLAPADRAGIIYDWGLYAGALGDLQLARSCYETYIGIAAAIPNTEGIATGLRTLAYTDRLMGSLEAALELVSLSLRAAAQAELTLDLAAAYTLRGRILHDLGRSAEAAADFALARGLGVEPFARRALWEAEYWLDMGDIARAVAQTERNLAGLHSLGWKGHEAQAHVLLGLAALRTDVPNLEVARTHLSAALPWTSTSTEVETSLRCIELEVELALAEKQEMTALALLERGRVLAECCGFGLFVTRFGALVRSSASANSRGGGPRDGASAGRGPTLPPRLSANEP